MDKKKKLLLIALGIVIAALAVFGVLKYRKATPLICLDAGHGGSDTGAMTDDRLEKDDNLKMTLAVGKILEEKGYRVIYTRKDDSTVSLEERYEFSNEKKATVFVSIHRNSADDTDVTGIEAWIKNTSPVPDLSLAKTVLKKLDEVGFGKNRGVSAGYRGDITKNYAVNAGTKCKSCLLELGFMTNIGDNKLFDRNFDAYAAAIADGIIDSL
ncbi:MAG TPA: N-acetylmuramoyl-L-alanine amidase [Ruminococcaceae bacterium]|nr:N-acetylmuramoyl-L-alanine amidase [Oscillospiraceae bacterium]